MDADLGHRLEVVVPHANRLRTLSCRGCTVDDFSHFSNRPVPLLETFHILPHDYLYIIYPSLPTLFNRDSPSLRELVVNGYDPFPNNHFKNLSSFNLQLSSGEVGPTFWTSLLAMLRDSPRLEELFLRFSLIYDYPPFSEDVPTPATLHALRKLHLRSIPSSLTCRFLNSVDLAPNGIAMQFTDIVPKFDWMFPPTLPPELSLHAVTSLEIVCVSTSGFIIQGTNPGVQIRVVKPADSDAAHADIFSQLVGPSSRLPLRELWIHIKRKTKYKLPPLSEFPNLEKLVVRVTTNGNPISRLLQMLNVDGHVPCPLLSTLDLSGLVNMEYLSRVLEALSKAGCRLGKLRLGKSKDLLMEDVLKLGIRDYVEEFEFSDEDGESRGMEFPAVCMTELGEWWEPWTTHQTCFL